jgi:hypothetical protein
MKLNPKRLLQSLFTNQKREMTRKLDKGEIIFIILALLIAFLLVLIFYSVPALKRIADAYFYMVKIIFFLIIAIVAFAYVFIKKL